MTVLQLSLLDSAVIKLTYRSRPVQISGASDSLATACVWCWNEFAFTHICYSAQVSQPYEIEVVNFIISFFFSTETTRKNTAGSRDEDLTYAWKGGNEGPCCPDILSCGWWISTFWRIILPPYPEAGDSIFGRNIGLPDRGSVVVKALCYEPEGRGFDTRWGEFLNLPNQSGRTRPWGLLSL
jgi:hypothetical protein